MTGELIAQFFSEVALPILSTLILTLVSAYAVPALKQLLKRMKIDTDIAFDMKMANLASSAVDYAAEKAADKLKKLNTPTSGNEKLDTALTFIMEHAPEVSKEQAERWVHSVLPHSITEGSKNVDRTI